MTFYSILALSAFMISLLGTRLTTLAMRKRIALIRDAVIKGQKNLPAPRGGGIAILFSLVICLAVADIHYALILSMLLLASVSLLDDLLSVPDAIRLLVQVMAIAVALQAMGPIFGPQLFPLWLDRLICGLLWLGFLRMFIRMDTIDGLATTETICIGIGLCLPAVLSDAFPDTLSTYSLIVAAAGCGFLWWNWHPARIRLGEVGSAPLGFVLGYLLLLAIASGYGYAVIILPAYYLSDYLLTLLQRIRNEKSIFADHEEHYHQRALQHGRRQDRVVHYIFGINILLIFLAMRSVIEPELAVFHLAMSYLTVFMLLGFFAHTGPDKSPPSE